MGSIDSHSHAGLEGTTMLIVTDARLWTPGGGRYFRFSGLVRALCRSVGRMDFITSRSLLPEDVARLRTLGFDGVTASEGTREPTLRSRLWRACPRTLAAALYAARCAAHGTVSRHIASRPALRSVSDLQFSRLARLVAGYLEGRTPDFLMVEYLMYASALRPLKDLPAHARPVTMIDTHDVTHQRISTLDAHGIRSPIALSWDEERTILGGFDIVIAIQDQDRQTFEAMCPERSVVTCLPPCAPDPVPPSAERCRKSLAFFGGRGYSGPNEQSLADFLDQAWPLIRGAHPTATLLVFGDTRDAFEGHSYPGVSFEGFVPDLRQAYSKAQVVISPVTFGGGLKTKVLEALAYGRPCVATTHSAIGFPEAKGHGLLVADDWTSFASIINRLLGEPERVREEGRLAAEYVAQHFNESRVMQDLVSAMQAHLAARNAVQK